MIQHINLLQRRTKDPIRKAHFLGTSVVVTIDPTHVRRLGIDEMTFFIERTIANGIVLEMHKIHASSNNKDDERAAAPTTDDNHNMQDEQGPTAD